jgi:hypothetical protein
MAAAWAKNLIIFQSGFVLFCTEEDEVEMNARPKCVIVTGRPGSGKTTLSKKLTTILHMPMLSRDEIKVGYVSSFGVSHEKLPSDTNQKVTTLFFSAIQMLLDANVSVVVEAAFQHRVWAKFIPELSGQVYFIICDVEPTLCAQRHLDRGLKDPSRAFYHGDHRVKVFRETGEFLKPGDYRPPSFDVPTLSVATTDGYTPELEDISAFIASESG